MQLRAGADARASDGRVLSEVVRRGAFALARAMVVLVLFGNAGRARADGHEAAVRTTVFREPSKSNEGVTVVHPQVNAKAALGTTASLNVNYDVDIVSGATPAVFGSRMAATGLDAITTATKFEDTRHEVRGGFGFSRPVADVAVAYGYGWEKDYKSHTVTASTRSDLLDRTLTLGIGFTHNWDRVCDANNSVQTDSFQNKALSSSEHCFKSDMTDVTTRRLTIDSLEPSLTWVVTPRLLLQGGVSLQLLNGFQSNPYRSVVVGPQGHIVQETLPTIRERYAVFGRFAYAFPDSRASLLTMVRMYRDTWDMRAATAEMHFNKYLGKSFLIGLRGRYHQQDGTIFYRDAKDIFTHGPTGKYWTGDRELSPMSNTLAGIKATLLVVPERGKSWYDELALELKWDTLFYFVPDDGPNSDRSYALIWQLAATLRF